MTPAGHASIRVTVPGRRGHIERRVAVEEAGRLQHEARPGDRHHRPVLKPDDVRRLLGIPAELRVFAALSFGYPAPDAVPARLGGRRPLDDSVHWDKW